MANASGKALKTSVTLDTKSAEKSLDRLITKINAIQKALGRPTIQAEKMDTELKKADSTVKKVKSDASKISPELNKGATAANKFNNALKKGDDILNKLVKRIGGLASAYLGVMGMGAIIQTSDTITGTENRLNALNGGDSKLTQESMDKMYGAAQSSRMNYGDMMANVSKSMTLAPDAFQGDIDNAIRFQEIMAKTYTLGGASQAEMSSSMYQMIQGLGSGVLQGDELRSVREGAPLAYKAIEEFAQGIYGADQNLKDLASQGKITSDIVVAAIMSSGEQIDTQFESTSMTFAQSWDMIKNTATKAFEPALQKLNDLLAKMSELGVFEALAWTFSLLGHAMMGVLNFIQGAITFIANNWYWLQFIVYGVIVALVALLAWWTTTNLINAAAVFFAWLAANAVWALWIIGIAAVIAAIVWLCGGVAEAAGFIMGIIFSILAIAQNAIFGIMNVGMALWESFLAICTNIGVAFDNLWIGAQNMFWWFIGECLKGVKWLEGPINAIASVFGMEGFTLSGLIEDVESKQQEFKSFVDVGAAWNKGINTWDYVDVGDAYQKGYDWAYNGVNAIGDSLSSFGDSLTNGTTLEPSYQMPTNDELLSGVNDTADNTGKMAKQMEMSEEDLAYLRDLANLEWKKEFTTAQIVVDMTNNNTINNQSDYEGWVMRLANDLRDELAAVADGV